jgi:mono/diheme cytochrome c family protein
VPAEFRLYPFASLVVAALAATAAASGTSDAGPFGPAIRPLLSQNCFPCHGPDDESREAGLRLDRRDAAIERGALDPDDLEASPLLARIRDGDPASRMPPPSSGRTLTAAEIATLTSWVMAGAAYEPHYAFTPPVRDAPPPSRFESLARNFVDRHLFPAIERAGLEPSPLASPATLVRRLSLDLRGLPPTLEEFDAYLAAHALDPEDAYRRLVDRFIADEAHGERMASLWLDLARYADSAGYGSDPLRTIWRYRDYVIDAFQDNVPFDRFGIEQLAGDLLPDATNEQRIATAFHRNSLTNTEGGTDDEEFRVAAVKDRANVTMQVFMGLTFGCAQCHTHKFDPITHDEYYRVFAFFDQTEDADRSDEAPLLALPPREREAEHSELVAEIARLDALERAGPSEPERAAAIAALQGRRAALETETVPILRELPADRRRVSHVLGKGDFRDRREIVAPGVPAAFHPWPDDAPRDRLGLARWIFAPDNPLTARVFVNRIFARLFGRGLVVTEEDFGIQGASPSHPTLLDALALEFIASGYDVQALIRLLVTSHAYRQESAVSPRHLEVDPENVLLARQSRLRVDAEIVRDQALAVSGLLSRKRYGEPVRPPQPPNLWRAAFNDQRTYVESEGEDRFRRAIYTVWRRTTPHPSLAAFDLPSRETCAIRRPRTSTPLQAFVTLNDPAFVECAQALGRRIAAGAGDDSARLEWGLRLTLVADPEPAEIAALLELLGATREAYRGRETEARALTGLDSRHVPPPPMDFADPADMAAWTVVANVLLNTDSFLTRP